MSEEQERKARILVYILENVKCGLTQQDRRQLIRELGKTVSVRLGDWLESTPPHRIEDPA